MLFIIHAVKKATTENKSSIQSSNLIYCKDFKKEKKKSGMEWDCFANFKTRPKKIFFFFFPINNLWD